MDDGVSGAELATRPGFLQLMNALTPRPDFHVLVMSEESRLGREAIETAYALKQIITSGVRVFFYLEDRERTLESPTDKILLSLTTYADDLAPLPEPRPPFRRLELRSDIKRGTLSTDISTLHRNRHF